MNKTDILDYLQKKKDYFHSTYQIVQIGLFGSYARGTQTEDSDIDILIEFEENTTSIFDKKFAFREEIETEFNHGVDVCRIKSIKSAFKGQILAEAVFA
jgi:predicted nucleotidyltransferase